MYDDKYLQILEHHRSIMLGEVRTESFSRTILKTVKLVLDTETVGNLAFEEGILGWIIDAKK
jgi:hypothetical protein